MLRVKKEMHVALTKNEPKVNEVNSFINISNKLHCPENKNNVIFQILDPVFKNEMVNINQTKDDIFNLYMIGYKNSKEMIFKNCIALTN